jgi:hypothetical protein
LFLPFCHDYIDIRGLIPYSLQVKSRKYPHLKGLILIILLLLCSIPLTSDEVKEDPYQVSLMTVGPGKPLYIWWGHIGLIVENRRDESSYFYDFGNFSFEEDNFYRNFAMGRLHYLSIRSRTEPYIRYLSFTNRTVTIYNLNLKSEEKAELVELLEEGVRPENRTYLYHHYTNNCSTRIRDLLDQILDGHIKNYTQSYALSFRDQSNRFIFPYWGYFILNYLQGSPVDSAITKWDSLFLPMELEQTLERLTRDGGEPLVTKKTMLFKGEERPIPTYPYPRLGDAFLRGMLLFMVTFLLRLKGKRGWVNIWRLLSLLFIALPGFLLFFMMSFTDHTVTHNNLNILVTFPPMILLLIPPSLYLKRIDGEKFRQRCWDIQALLVLLSLLAGTLPGLHQDNLGIILLYLPLYLAWGLPGSVLIEAVKLPQRSFKWSQKF